MGWFDEQIKERIKTDNETVAQSFARMKASVVGNSAIDAAFRNDREKAEDALETIFHYYHIKKQKIPKSLTNVNDILEYAMRPSGIMRKNVLLKEKWYEDAVGVFLGTKKDGELIALVPDKFKGYYYYDASLGKKVHINRNTAKEINEEAFCFYKPLPQREIGIKDLLIFIVQSLSIKDFVALGLATLFITFLGFISPTINNFIFSKLITSGSLSLLFSTTLMLLGVAVSTLLLGITKSLILKRMQTKMDIAVEAAGMMRVLSMPTSFFKSYTAGDLASRLGSLSTLCSTLVNTILTTGLTSLFSFAYFSQMFRFAPSLSWLALGVLVVTLVFSLIGTLWQIKITQKRLNLSIEENSLSYSLISGIQKIKLTSAENRAFGKWANVYSKLANYTYNPPLFLKLQGVFSTAISMIGTVAIYYLAVINNVSVANYLSFTMSYGNVSGALAQLVSIAATYASIGPILQVVKPILDNKPEISENKSVVTSLNGNIELMNVTFRYNESSPVVIDNLSLKINKGDYIAIVGKTGCGKSTLVRLLLGFEKPQSGNIFYDNKNLNKLDLKSVRQNMGVVTQDGKLFQGDIFSNISVSASNLTMEEAWKVAETANAADMIRAMPMGMHTIITEGSGGISGGQKQRLMIARAIAPKPKILIFDEATSALDNITQKKISQALDNIKCTRIVIAHRLSTIKNCNRIIVLEQGHIIEDGTYDELINAKGFFADLVARQQLDNT
ncbi:MAG: ATP-binding cassette domain-containing protein [Acutalibacteraceae bacterium]